MPDFPDQRDFGGARIGEMMVSFANIFITGTESADSRAIWAWCERIHDAQQLGEFADLTTVDAVDRVFGYAREAADEHAATDPDGAAALHKYFADPFESPIDEA